MASYPRSNLETTAYLTDFKLDSENWWDDAFKRAYSGGVGGGHVGRDNGPRVLMLPSPAFGPPYSSTGGLRITQTIKAPSQTRMIGGGGLGTVINCADMAGDDSETNMDGIHFGYPNTHNHFGTVEHMRINHAPRHGISTYKSAFGENTFIDNTVCNLCGEAGIFIDNHRAFKPLRIGAVNMSGCKYGLLINDRNFRSQAYVGFISGDNNLKALVQVQGNPGSRTTALHIDRIKCEVSKPVNENIVNLRSGTGGWCHIGTIYQDCIVDPSLNPATYRAINMTEDTGDFPGWRLTCDGWYRSDNTPLWDNELAYDDGRLQLTWNQVNRIRFESQMKFQYLSWLGHGAQDGVDERLSLPSSAFEDIRHSVNGFNKWKGKPAFDETLGIPVHATGTARADVWNDAMGGVRHIPKP